MDVSGGDDDLTPDERAVFEAVGRLLVLVLVGSTGAWLAGRFLVRTRRGTVLWLRKSSTATPSGWSGRRWTTSAGRGEW